MFFLYNFFEARECPNEDNYWPCRCDQGTTIDLDIFCENVAPSEMFNIFRRTVPVELFEFTIKGSTANDKELHLPAHFFGLSQIPVLKYFLLE